MSRQDWFKKIPDIGEEATFLRKWGFIGILIGVGAGFGALALIWSIRFITQNVLVPIVGYAPPLPGGEGGITQYLFHMERPWLLPVVTAGAGLVSGFLIWKLAPETAGIGTNAAIRAFHANEKVKVQTSIFKLVTSAITIGCGLTSGREGPIAQIGAATGASIADALKLTARERNIALAAGLGAGIAAIFKAPLAGAIIGAEIFYTEDFEVEALVPGLIASVVGYSIVGSYTGFQPIFNLPEMTQFIHPWSLVLFGLLGVGCGLLARSLFAIFFRVERSFKRFPLWLAAAIGGAGTGLIGLAIPSVLGTGYGWAQFAIGTNPVLLTTPMAEHLGFVVILLIAAFAEIVSASLTLGSGNSGGVFGPCVVTGGMFGGAFGYASAYLFPSLGLYPGNFAIVGMIAFFAAAAKAPISTIIMISEMTGGYGLLAPGMFAVVTAFILSGKKTIFPAQVHSRLDSPYHADEFEPIVLRRVKTSDVMIHLPVHVNVEATVADAISLMSDYGLSGLPVLENNKLCGRITLRATARVPEDQRQNVHVKEVMSNEVYPAFPEEDLFTILKRFAAHDVDQLPVVKHKHPDYPVGLITRSGLWSAIEIAKEQRAERKEKTESLPKQGFFSKKVREE
jgi:CIC family chloride channel protein